MSFRLNCRHPLHTATVPLSALMCMPDAAPAAPTVDTHTATTLQPDVTPGALVVLDSMCTIALAAIHPSLVLLDLPPPGTAAMISKVVQLHWCVCMHSILLYTMFTLAQQHYSI